MPDYSININTDAGDREAGLQQAVTLYNAAVADRNIPIVASNAELEEGEDPQPLEPELDGKQYLQKNFDAVIDSYAANVVSKTLEELKDNFSRADQAARDQVVQLLAQFQPAALPAEVKVA